jgi:hypothetical protein
VSSVGGASRHVSENAGANDANETRSSLRASTTRRRGSLRRSLSKTVIGIACSQSLTPNQNATGSGPPIYWNEKVLSEAPDRLPKGGEYLGAGQLTIVNTLAALESTGLANGVVVGATSPYRKTDKLYDEHNAEHRRQSTLSVCLFCC